MRLVLRSLILLSSYVIAQPSVALAQVSVTTYHNDPQRTGWNSSESTLTPAAFKSNIRATDQFGLIAVVGLDGQVDTQPLIVASVAALGTHPIVYVATESNSIYAIDSLTGAILKRRNLGPPVGPFETWRPAPYTCTNNSDWVGINGTPTIDLPSSSIYVMNYTTIDTKPTYQLHALDLATLNDRPGSPVTVSAIQTLRDGKTYQFDATWQRQRAALLLSQNRIYAAFGSFCDMGGSHSRGWLLGWDKNSLALFSAKQLNNKLPGGSVAVSPHFLSSIWMSGYGIAADGDGNLYFTTGNTESGTYDSSFNISESAVKMSSDLSRVIGVFTPSNVNDLDTHDMDFGSGGLMVLPDGTGLRPEMRLAVAAGKDGRLFILNRDKMGLRSANIPQAVDIGACWCGPSYFQTKGRTLVSPARRVVTSGGDQVELWAPINTEIQPAPRPPLIPSLTLLGSAQVQQAPGTDGGFFTSISSNGTSPNSTIIWAVARAGSAGSDLNVRLYAFDATPVAGTLPLLWSGKAGEWWNTLGEANANIVPTVANGRVFVASFWQLQIFGLRPPVNAPIARVEIPVERRLVPPRGGQLWGTVRSIEGTKVMLELRTGNLLQLDISSAMKEERLTTLRVGQNVRAIGQMNSHSVFEASTVLRAKGRPLWGEDHEQ